jgi:methylenetetrahydrofolate dehydrogenase (NADP+) / methenyltetrahydrofolate cyclohydrolase
MLTRIINGTAIAQRYREGLVERIANLAAHGTTPALHVVLVGNDPASKVYVRNKTRACSVLGLSSKQWELPVTITEGELLSRIAELNADPRVHGILVQLPLPKHIAAHQVTAAISPAKDVDGFHLHNLGALVTGQPGFVPCTAAGVLAMLKHEGVVLRGRHAVVVGRSNIVGKPLAMLLLANDATVTICHSATVDLGAMTRSADILVVATGKPRLIGREMVKPGAVVIDVGINRSADGKLVGDCDFEALQGVASLITPVPGGVGPVTIAMLMENTVSAAERSLRGLLAPSFSSREAAREREGGGRQSASLPAFPSPKT